MKKKINVFVVAGCSITCAAFNTLLDKESDTINLCEDMFTFDEMISCERKDIDILLICMKILHFTGIEKFHELCTQNPNIRMIVFNADASDKKVLSLIAYGVKGIIYTNDPPDHIIKSIKKVHEGELWIKREILTQFIESSYPIDITSNSESVLTKREREILYMLAKGYSNNDIMKKLGVSLTTVKTHIYRIYKKTNIKNRAEAASYFKGL
jgi:LuxR family transcriptional regulator of csgAB operon